MSAPSGGDPCAEPVVRLPVPGDTRIRVVEVLATGSNGGAQEHLYGLLSRIDQTRYDVCVVSLSAGSGARKIARLGVPVTIVDHPDDEVAIRAVVDRLSDARPDVVHNHMFRAEVVGTRAVLALERSTGTRPYVISTVHSSRVRSVDDRALIRSLTPSMDRLVAVSRAIETKIADERGCAAPVRLIYNGVDLDRYHSPEPVGSIRQELGVEPGAPIVGVVARLEPEKGHPTLLDAWAAVATSWPTARLVVVGEGSRREPLEAQAMDLGIADSVVFTGRRDDIPAVTAALDIAVLPSYREAQGLTILEAMARSRPVIASDVGGIPEMIEDGRTGLLVPPHDAGALAGSIDRLLGDRPLAETLARAGHDLVHDRFCIQLMVNAIEALYDEGAAAVRLSEAVAV